MDNKEYFTPLDILWFKNVSDPERGEAYLNLTDDIFLLHFPNEQKGNVLSPGVNEIILIYQRVNDIPAFTHLVTPVDNELVDENRDEFRYARRVRVIAKTNNDNFIPVEETLWKRVKKSGITQGNACNINNIKNIGNIEELQLDIWNRFYGYFISEEQESEKATSAAIADLELTNPDFNVTEGGLSLVSHIVKERNKNIVIEKKRIAAKNNQMICEVCNFSFAVTYDADFIECHHLNPISQGGVRKTKLEDLALVCSNCHRMLHRKFNEKYLSIQQLQERMSKK
ncbi:MAG: HNH endonuclease [Treponema sp.]|nr:HNH endonuclease [Treponema sp.]